MLLKDDKKGLVTIIMKRMKGHGDMSPSFASEAQEVKTSEGAEQDYESGYDSCCNEMISAFKSGDSQKLKNSLRSFISMVIDEQDESEY
jgi:hypothetical protein